jgi:hypothetical protein
LEKPRAVEGNFLKMEGDDIEPNFFSGHQTEIKSVAKVAHKSPQQIL